MSASQDGHEPALPGEQGRVDAVVGQRQGTAAVTGSGVDYRPDIEGLRAIAVLGVVLFHAHLPQFGGGFVGVDVFYVLSGFLITSLIVAEVEKTGRLSLAKFWGRRMRRLLPAAALVLLATLAASFVVLDALSFRQAVRDIISAAAYVSNWNFAAQAVDYLAADAPPSPVLHYWSLSVEEQFYVIWPLLFAGIAAFTARRRITAFRRRQWGAAVALIGVSSFAWSWWLTSHNQPYAFFSTPTRAWQLALGAAVALSARFWARRSPALRTASAVFGLALIGYSFVMLRGADAGTAYPGLWALLPTVGTAAVVASGIGLTVAPRWSVHGLLALPPMRFLGRLSYSWYLWHWPPLVLVVAYVGHEVSVLQRVVCSVLALGLAWLTFRFVEDPIRRATPLARSAPRSLIFGGVATVAVVTAAIASLAIVGDVRNAPKPAGGLTLPDPTASSTYPPGTYVLGPREAQLQRPVPYYDGCHVQALSGPELLPCVYGDPAASKTAMLIGDSHAVQWWAGLDKASKARGYKFVSWTRSGCPWFELAIKNMKTGLPYPECVAWQRNVMAAVKKSPPDVLFLATIEHGYRAQVGSGFLDIDASQPLVTKAILRTLPEFVATGAKVVVLRDTPHMGVDVPTCVMKNLKNPERCAMPRDKGFAGGGIDARTASTVPGVAIADFTPTLCGPAPRPCDVVRQGMVLYRDSNHINITYSGLLAPLFYPYLK